MTQSPDSDNPHETPRPVQPLSYANLSTGPKQPVVLPLLFGLIVGIGVICFLGVFLAVRGNANGIPIGVCIGAFAVMVIVSSFFSFRQIRSPQRGKFYWFNLGILLGAGTTSLLEGICFTAFAH